MRLTLKILAVLGIATAGHAADSYWTNISASAVNWNTTTAWSNGLPTAADRAIFGVTNAGTINLTTTPWTFTDVLVTNKIGSAGGTYTFLFNSANKTGTIYNSFIIGDGGVAGQAKFRATATGVLAITNNGTGKLIVGAGGNGTLTLESSAAGNNMAVWADQIIVGRDNNFTGTINQLTRTYLFASNLVVGSSGVGALTQSAASTTNLISGQLVLGETSTGQGTYTLDDATAVLALTNGGTAQLIVGQNGAGNLTLTTGKLVVDNLLIATNAGSRGTFTWTAGSALTVINSSDGWSIFTNLITPNLSGPTQWGSNSLQALIFNTNLVGTVNYYNGLVLGASVGGTGVVSLGQAGVLGTANYYVTNNGNAQLIVGQNGGGSLTLNAGNLSVDQLLVTNNIPGSTKSSFTFGGGTLTTSNLNGLAAHIVVASNATFNINGNWNMNGGTNITSGLSTLATVFSFGKVIIGNGVSNAVVTVNPGAVWSLNNPAAPGTYSNLNFFVGSGSATGNALVINGGVVTNVGSPNASGSSLGGSGNSLIISNGGQLSAFGLVVAGSSNLWQMGGLGASSFASIAGGQGSTAIVLGGSGNNQLIVSNATLVCPSGSTTIGSGNNNNTVSVLTGGVWTLGFFYISDSAGGTGNVVLVNGGVLNSGRTTIGGPSGAGNGSGNSLIISNGGQYNFVGDTLTVGSGAGGSNNLFQVGGFGARSTASITNTANLTVGSSGASFNTMNVTNASLSSGLAIIGNAATNNTVNVQAGGTWNLLGQNLTVGSGSATGNVAWVQAGGLLDAGGLLVNAGAGNRITNSGGIYQFNTATPGISNGVAISDGTISFRDLGATVVNLTNNWRGSQLTNIAWSGNNALRLNNSTATNSLAGGYTFQTGNPTNYYRLEMINTSTGIRGFGVTIGATGSFLASNTTATLSGVFTNNSADARLVNSAVDFAGGLHVAGTLSLANSYVKGAGAKTIASGGRLEGNGTVVGSLTVDGTIAPGFSQGSITFSNDLTLSGTAEMELLSGGNLGTADKINVLGALTGSGVVKVITNGVFTIVSGDKWDLFDFTGTPSLTFDGSAVLLDPGLLWDTSQLNIDGTISITAVPEPSSLVLCGSGLALTLIVLRRRRPLLLDEYHHTPDPR